ncbi:Splicing factor 3A subunit 3 like protein [Aduncisulcus paluster]|uniref:Splicing factor 3A subunit 3 like protein n=1 Tax=Aduncisulcus paluster TaxID=2918883 RepID=A0ABQ5JQ62_9EUKA|nr:Splicing factor 3A subunit 3 like protein [Aduncisulcus paluster]
MEPKELRKKKREKRREEEEAKGLTSSSSSFSHPSLFFPSFCPFCDRQFKSYTLFSHHLSGKKCVKCREKIKSELEASGVWKWKNGTQGTQEEEEREEERGRETIIEQRGEKDEEKVDMMEPQSIPGTQFPSLPVLFSSIPDAQLLTSTSSALTKDISLHPFFPSHILSSSSSSSPSSRILPFPLSSFQPRLLISLLISLASLLGPVIKHTRSRIEGRTASTGAIVGIEPSEEESDVSGDLDGGDKQVGPTSDDKTKKVSTFYKSKTLPILADGLSIAPWLYKIQGLKHKFECEICGKVYEGQQSFEQHFNNITHTKALKAIGIPNSRYMFGVVSVKDALKLHAEIQKEGERNAWVTFRDEEIQDRAGKVWRREEWQERQNMRKEEREHAKRSKSMEK